MGLLIKEIHDLKQGLKKNKGQDLERYQALVIKKREEFNRISKERY